MRCEVVAVGTELLLGQIVDTNSSWIGEQLALAGIDSHFQTKVGDNLERMVSCIRLALSRSNAVIACGGLGPTQDDITREAIAAVMGVELERDAEMGARIRRLFESRGRRMTENNLRQADRPAGAAFIPEMPGTAPGLICPVGGKVVYAVPGVPWEMRLMLEKTVLPDLQRRAGVAAAIRSRVVKTWGETESGLAERLAGRIAALDRSGAATLAFQASGIEGLKVRITAKADDAAAAHALVAEEEKHVREILGDVVFGADDDTMESVVLDMLRERGQTLAVAETLTGGLIGARMTEIAGAGEVFRGALVSTPDRAPGGLSALPDGPVASPEAAAALADAVRGALGADVGLATTGVAGPEPVNGHAPGTVFLGMALGDRVEAREVRLPGRGRRIRQYAVISLLNYFRRALLSLSPTPLWRAPRTRDRRRMTEAP